MLLDKSKFRRLSSRLKVDVWISIKLLFVNQRDESFTLVTNAITSIKDMLFLDRSKSSSSENPLIANFSSSIMLLSERLRECNNSTFHSDKVLFNELILFPEKSVSLNFFQMFLLPAELTDP
jgi:hypothetical protein